MLQVTNSSDPPQKAAPGLGSGAHSLLGAPIPRAERINDMYQNRLSLIGFTGSRTEFTKNGTAYAVLSLATKTSWKNDKDEWESRTEWPYIIVRSKLAEF